MAPDLVTVGGLTVDHVVTAEGEVALDRAGGNGAYSAVGALHWCGRVGLVSLAVASYPRDPLARLAAAGLDLAGVVWSPARPNAGNWFIYDAEGRRDEGLASPGAELAAAGFPTDRLDAGQIAAWRARLAGRVPPEGELSHAQFRAAHPLTPAQVPAAFVRARGVHLAPSDPGVMCAMLDLFAPGGARIVADPGWQLAARPLPALAPLLSRLDAFLPSEVELQALVPGAAPAEGLAVLAGMCPGAVAVKLGARGVLVWDRAAGAAVAVPAAPAAARDPTGAGDAFSGGFLAGLVETGDPVAAARFGAVAAARIVETFGADGALPVDRPAARRQLARLTGAAAA